MTLETTVLLVQIALGLSGAWLAWQEWQSFPGRWPARLAQPLALWPVDGLAFGIAVVRLVLGLLATQWATIQVLEWASLMPAAEAPSRVLVYGLTTQVGLLAGVLLAGQWMRRVPVAPWEQPESLGQPPPLPRRRVLVAGAATFLVALAGALLLTVLWKGLLSLFSIELSEQDMLAFLKDGATVPQILLVVVMATVLAPIAEELIFRAGLFRFCRDRLPRAAGYLLPAVLFAGIHYSLVALPGLIFFAFVLSYAYERTGRIAVTMVAHALFNLNTLLQALLVS